MDELSECEAFARDSYCDKDHLFMGQTCRLVILKMIFLGFLRSIKNLFLVLNDLCECKSAGKCHV